MLFEVQQCERDGSRSARTLKSIGESLCQNMKANEMQAKRIQDNSLSSTNVCIILASNPPFVHSDWSSQLPGVKLSENLLGNILAVVDLGIHVDELLDVGLELHVRIV